MTFEFTWDDQKAEANVLKHGVPFIEAASVFYDPLAVTYRDGEHSLGEPRFLTFGISQQNRILVISHVETRKGFRIISARKVTREERKIYEEGQ